MGAEEQDLRKTLQHGQEAQGRAICINAWDNGIEGAPGDGLSFEMVGVILRHLPCLLAHADPRESLSTSTS